MPVPSFLWINKLWRSLLYSLSRKTPMAISRWGSISYEQIPSPYYNPRIVALVLDVLNGVAHDLHRIGAVYAHTDGAIIPYHLAHLAHEVYQSWGLEYAQKGAGESEILAVGSYTVGAKTTVKRRKAFFRHISTPPHLEWLRPRFQKLGMHNKALFTISDM
jgi:hypothetical protein